MTTRKFVTAAVQMCAGDDVRANLQVCKRLAAEAAGAGAALLVLPECFAFIGLAERDKFAVAEVIDAARPGPILNAVLDMARSQGVWVIAGGMPEILPEQAGAEITRTYNTCVVVSPAAEIAATYRKIHLFDVDIPGGAVLCESSTTAPGSTPVAAMTPLGRIALSICYDLRFPELYRALVAGHGEPAAKVHGADLAVVPAAFTAHTGAAHWHVLLRARAIENQFYVIAAAQAGRHNPKRESYGHSMIVDPWGRIVAEQAEGEGVVLAEIDLDLVDRTRQQMPCLEHRRLEHLTRAPGRWMRPARRHHRTPLRPGEGHFRALPRSYRR
jgi:predicted amidohydrolase